MRKPKFLHLPALQAMALAASALALAGCAGTRAVSTPRDAENIAVELANDKCQHEFGKRPFKTGAFPAARSGDRWLWGWLDAKSGRGYTAQVSFHSDGTDPQVAVSLGAEGQVDLEDPDAPSLNGTPDASVLTRQKEPEETE